MASRITSILCLLLLLGLGPASAQNSAFQTHYKQGLKLAYKKSFQPALQEFARALVAIEAALKKAPSSQPLRKNKQKLLYIMGRSHQYLKQPIEAHGYYLRCLALDATSKAGKLAKKRSSALERQVLATLVLSSSPTKAQAELRHASGKSLTLTMPIKRVVLPGRYRLTLRKEGFKSATFPLELKAGTRLEKQFNLAAKGVKLTLRSTPKQAALTLTDSKGQKRTGVTPFVTSVSPGLWKVQLKKPGYQVFQAALLVKMGRAQEASYTLEPMLSRLSIDSNPPGADVELIDKDGRRMLGKTPYQAQIPAGPVKIRLSKRGFESQRAEVKVAVGASLKRSFALVKGSSGPFLPLALTFFAVGAGALAGGLALLFISQGEYTQFQALQKKRIPTRAHLSQVVKAHDDALTKEVASYVLFGVAAVAAAAGVVFVVFHSRGPSPTPPPAPRSPSKAQLHATFH